MDSNNITLEEFKKEYNKAVERAKGMTLKEKDSLMFTVKGKEFLVGYVKYLIMFLEEVKGLKNEDVLTFEFE